MFDVELVNAMKQKYVDVYRGKRMRERGSIEYSAGLCIHLYISHDKCVLLISS